MTVYANEILLGNPTQTGGASEQHLLELTSRAYHVNFVGFYPVNTKLDLIGSVGFSFVNLEGDDTILNPGFDSINKLYSKTKGILELGGGIKYMLNQVFGIKATVSWQNKSRLEPLNGISGANQLTAKIKNGAKRDLV